MGESQGVVPWDDTEPPVKTPPSPGGGGSSGAEGGGNVNPGGQDWLFPYTCDRTDQYSAFQDKVKVASGRPLLCIVHGEDKQSVFRFVQCLREHKLPQDWSLHTPSWKNWASRPQKQCESCANPTTACHVVESIYQNVQGDYWVPVPDVCAERGRQKEVVIQQLSRNTQPIVLVWHCHMDEWSKERDKQLTLFSRFWLDGGGPFGGLRRPVIVVLSLEYRGAIVRSINAALKGIKKEFERRDMDDGLLLLELKDVQGEDVKTWFTNLEVEKEKTRLPKHWEGWEPKVRAYFERCGGRDSMESLVKALKRFQESGELVHEPAGWILFSRRWFRW